MKTEFIDNYFNVSLLQLQSIGFFNEHTDRISLDFQSCITGLGDWEIHFLVDLYAQLLHALDISHQISDNKRSITAEGHSLYQLLKGEEGIHLFYVAHQNPLPIRVLLRKEGASSNNEQSYKVIRIYDGTNTLTDLRTGFSNEVNITANEFKLLIFGGIDPKLRDRVVPF